MSYTLPDTVFPALESLMLERVGPVLATRDFNLIPAMLQQRFKLAADKMARKKGRSAHFFGVLGALPLLKPVDPAGQEPDRGEPGEQISAPSTGGWPAFSP